MQSNKSLADKLEHYSTTSCGQGVRSKSAAEWAGYAAGASLAMAGAADASIIYSGVQNVSAQIDPSIQTSVPNFDFGSAATFTVGGSQFTARAATGAAFFSNLATGKYFGGAGISAAPYGAQFLGSNGGFAVRNGAILAASQLIGPSGIFATLQAGRERTNNHTASGLSNNVNYGNFPLGVTGFAGVKLASGNYAWIRLKVEDLGLNQPFRDYFALTNGFPARQRPKLRRQDHRDRLGLREQRRGDPCRSHPIVGGTRTFRAG